VVDARSIFLLSRSEVGNVEFVNANAFEEEEEEGEGAYLGGPVNGGFTLGKRQLNFSITGPPRYHTLTGVPRFVVEND
jgi:hypothetical protein